jgi:hypothetical protein
VAAPAPAVDSSGAGHHHRQMITNPCMATSSKKFPVPGILDRRAR